MFLFSIPEVGSQNLGSGKIAEIYKESWIFDSGNRKEEVEKSKVGKKKES